MAVNRFVRSLAHAWKAATGYGRTSGRDDLGAVVNLVPSPSSFGRCMAATPSEYRKPRSIMRSGPYARTTSRNG